MRETNQSSSRRTTYYVCLRNSNNEQKKFMDIQWMTHWQIEKVPFWIHRHNAESAEIHEFIQ